MAHLITVGRLLLLMGVVWLIYRFRDNVDVISACMVLLIVVFVSDGLDGFVARRRGSTSAFGAVFDIAGDRIVENVLWVVFADLDVIPVWVPILVLTRGFVVDSLRSLSYADGMTAFGDRNMMRSALTRWLTAGRFMRGLYGYAKAIAFVYLTGLVAWEQRNVNDTWIGSLYGQQWFRAVGWALTYGTVALTVVRGVPVIYDSLGAIREQPQPQPLASKKSGA